MPAASRSAASSVSSAASSGSTRASAVDGGRPSARPAASGRSRHRRDRRSPSTTSPSTRLSVSLTGSTGIAAPCSAAARATASTRRSTTSGRAPSWTSGARAEPALAAPSLPRARGCRPRRTPGDARHPAPPRRPSRAARRAAGSAACSAVRTSAIRSTRGDAAIAARDQARTGRPARSAASLSRPPIRSDLPAATTTASATMPSTRSALSGMGEDHAAGDRLEHARHGHVDLGVDRLGAALDDDHRPVVEVADALAGVLAGLDDADARGPRRAAARA